MKATDVMIDLETLGTKPGCVVLSIGACAFDRFSGEIGERFYTEINRLSSAELGLYTDSSTEDWWEQQGEEAQSLLNRCEQDYETLSVAMAIHAFCAWMGDNAPTGKDLRGVWANDPTFDLSILGHIFDLLTIKAPWPFWAERSCRTIVDLGKTFGTDPKKDMEFSGTKHHALDDAIHQTKYVSAIFNHIKEQTA